MTDLQTLRLGFAFSAGVATFFAPCAYPLLPSYVAFYVGDAEETASLGGRLRQAALVGGLTSVGFFLVYAVLAGVAAAVGTRLLRNVAMLEVIVGGTLVALGVGMASGRLTPGTLDIPLPARQQSKTGYLLFGIVYAVAAAGCTAPIFVAIAGVALGSGPLGAVLAFAAYAAGMALLMVALTVLVALGRDSLVRRLSASTGRITQAAGVLLILGGTAQVTIYLVWFGGLAQLGLA